MTDLVPVLRGSGPLADLDFSRQVSPGGVGFANKQVYKHLVQADLATLHSDPVTLISAPGTGKIIIPWDFFDVFDVPTTAYSYGHNSGLYFGTSVAAFTYNSCFGGVTILTNAFSVLGGPILGASVQWTDAVINQPLLLYDSSADDTSGGDGVLDIWINYFVIDTSGVIQP